MSKKRDWAIIGLLFVNVFAMAAIAILAVNLWAQDNITKNTVYQVCQHTRMTPEIEESCGIAMDNSKTEYLCTQNNNLPTNRCWVEDK